MRVKSFTQVAEDDIPISEEINEFIKDKRVIDVKYIATQKYEHTNPYWIIAFVHYEDSAPSSIDVVPQEETEELEEES